MVFFLFWVKRFRCNIGPINQMFLILTFSDSKFRGVICSDCFKANQLVEIIYRIEDTPSIFKGVFVWIVIDIN